MVIIATIEVDRRRTGVATPTNSSSSAGQLQTLVSGQASMDTASAPTLTEAAIVLENTASISPDVYAKPRYEFPARFGLRWLTSV